jgi:hypothetical protein
MRGQRRGSPNVQEVTWTIERAQHLNLTTKDNWRKQPQAMLQARATAEIARLVASDVILGIPFAAEELADQEPEPTRRVGRKKAEVVALPPALPPRPIEDVPLPDPDEPALDEPAAEPPTEAPSPITDAQKKKMHASFNDLGVTDRGERLRITRGIVGRDDLTSANDLTKADAMGLLDVLEDCAKQGDQVALYAAAGLLAEPPEGES